MERSCGRVAGTPLTDPTSLQPPVQPHDESSSELAELELELLLLLLLLLPPDSIAEVLSVVVRVVVPVVVPAVVRVVVPAVVLVVVLAAARLLRRYSVNFCFLTGSNSEMALSRSCRVSLVS